jgi:hypothetical protein
MAAERILREAAAATPRLRASPRGPMRPHTSPLVCAALCGSMQPRLLCASTCPLRPLLILGLQSSARLQWPGNPSPISGLPFPLVCCSCFPSLRPSAACACCALYLYCLLEWYVALLYDSYVSGCDLCLCFVY